MPSDLLTRPNQPTQTRTPHRGSRAEVSPDRFSPCFIWGRSATSRTANCSNGSPSGATASPAELAFTALVERHGPMVLRVCSALLRDPHDAQDAFQATFLVLLRKSRELWVHDSLGPWLHRVARRTAERAQAIATPPPRVRAPGGRVADHSRPLAAITTQPGSVLHEEIDRLPERLRVLVVLCHLEGQSQELAAKTLSLPVGTVKSRLHRARDLLRDRLTQRGVRLLGRALSPRNPLAQRPMPSIRCRCMSRWFTPRHGRHESSRPEQVRSRRAQSISSRRRSRPCSSPESRIGVALALLAGCLALAQPACSPSKTPARTFHKAARGRAAIPQAARPQAPAGRPAPAPAYIRRSRTMIIERLEQELSLAEQRLDLTTANVRTPNDPEVVRARKTVETLAGLLARVDAVLVEAVDEFPTIFDFSNARRSPRCGRGSPGRRTAPSQERLRPRPPVRIRRTLPGPGSRTNGMVAPDARKRIRQQGRAAIADVAEYEALKARIDADIARGSRAG